MFYDCVTNSLNRTVSVVLALSIFLIVFKLYSLFKNLKIESSAYKIYNVVRVVVELIVNNFSLDNVEIEIILSIKTEYSIWRLEN